MYLALFPYLVLTFTPAKYSKSDGRDQLFLNFQTQDKWLRCLFNRIHEDDNVFLNFAFFFFFFGSTALDSLGTQYIPRPGYGDPVIKAVVPVPRPQ